MSGALIALFWGCIAVIGAISGMVFVQTVGN